MNENMVFEKVRALVTENVPCPELAALFSEHKCLYLLSRMDDPNAKMEEHLIKIAVTERYQTCAPVFAALKETPYAVIKGAVLSKDAYGSPFLRKSGDIDLLTAREHIDTVKQIFLDQGFIQGRVTEQGLIPFSRRELLFQTAMSHQTAPFVKETSNRLCPYVNIDVNLDILWGESETKADMDMVLQYTVDDIMLGVPVRKLSPEMAFLSLCLHHYKDMNSIYLLYEGSLRLGLFCDIYFAFHNFSIDLELLIQLGERLSIIPYLYYCVYYTNLIFADASLSAFLEKCKTGQSQSLLESFGLTGSERKKWQISFEERLFAEDIRSLLDGRLDEADREKIALNERFM